MNFFFYSVAYIYIELVAYTYIHTGDQSHGDGDNDYHNTYCNNVKLHHKRVFICTMNDYKNKH